MLNVFMSIGVGWLINMIDILGSETYLQVRQTIFATEQVPISYIQTLFKTVEII